MPTSRLVGQGHRDGAKPFFVNSASGLRQSSTKLLVSTSEVFKLSRNNAALFNMAEDELLNILFPP